MGLRTRAILLILGALAVGSTSTTDAAGAFSPLATVFIVAEDGTAYTMEADALTGWPLLLPLPVRPKEAFASASQTWRRAPSTTRPWLPVRNAQ
jgi:hypothetical protein